MTDSITTGKSRLDHGVILDNTADATFCVGRDTHFYYLNEAACKILGYSRAEFLTLTIGDIAPRVTEDWSIFWNSVKTRGHHTLNTTYLTKAGNSLPVELSIAYFRQKNQGYTCWVARDITQRTAEVVAIERRQRQLEILSSASKNVNTILDVKLIIRTLVSSAIELVRGTSGAAGLVRNGTMVFTEYNNNGTLIPIDYSFTPGYGVPGHVMETGHPYLSNDTQNDPHVVPDIRAALGFYNLIDVPILDPEGKLIGCFEIHNKHNHDSFDHLDKDILEALAASAAVALRNAQLLLERDQSETSLRESEEHFRLLVEQAGDAMFLHDTSGKILDVNRIACDMCGYTHDEMLTINVVDLAKGTQPDALISTWENMSYGTPITAEGAVRRKDGTRFPVEVRVSRFISRGRDLILALVRDITARKTAENEAKVSHDNMRLILESSGEGIFGIDLDLRCTFCNRATSELLGYTQEHLRGKDMHQLAHYAWEDGSPYPREECRFYRALIENRDFPSEDGVFWHKDGYSIPVQYSCNRIVDDGNLKGAVVVVRNVAEARAVARRVEYLATHDPLTGLVNRHEFEHRLERVLESARKNFSEHILCYVDLDQFKVVNDTCGHHAGDALLKQLSTLLHDKFRAQDTLARIGGDEFAIILENCHIDRAIKLTKKIQEAIRNYRFSWKNKQFIVGASIGIVVVTSAMENASDALSAADTACYMAKEAGRNRIHVYSADDTDIASRHIEMECVSQIHDALDNGLFELYYQPIVCTGDYHSLTTRFEVLIRMRDAAGGIILPGLFIPAAERYNLMPKIDRWVIDHTFGFLARNKGRLSELSMCSINVSGGSVGDGPFLNHLLSSLKKNDIQGDKICIEITETSAVTNRRQALHFMKTLKELGVRFSLDDFGSGMSSYEYLKSLPVDYIKVAGNFVRDIVNDHADHAMVDAINSVAHVMGIKTIAEGVERKETMDVLRKIGVDYVQGFVIARPRALADIWEAPARA